MKRITTGDVKVFASLYENGLTIKRIAAKTGFSYTTIQRHLVDHDVSMRSPGRERMLRAEEKAVKG